METLVLLLLKVTVVGAIGRVLLAAVRNASASVRYILAVVTLGAMLSVVAVAATGVEWRLEVLRPALPRAERQIMSEEMVGEPPPAPARAPGSASASSPAPALPAVQGSPAQAEGGWFLWLALAYAIGCVLALARVVAGLIAIRSVSRNAAPVDDEAVCQQLDRARAMLGIAEPVRVAVSRRAAVPATWGVARPVILLPERALAWPAERLRMVFLHELAHWVRRDVLTLLLRRGLTAVLWFHPIAWSLERVARRECERACDDVVLGVGTRAVDYASELLFIAQSLPDESPLPSVTLAIARGSEFEGRVKAILGVGRPRSSVSRSALSGIAVAAALVVVPLAAVQAVAQPSEPPQHSSAGVLQGEKTEAAIAPVGERKTDQADKWAQLGKTYFRQHRFEEAIEALSTAIRADPFHASARYNLACAYAMRGDRTAALGALRDAVYAGYSGGRHIREDTDLASIRGTELEALATLSEELSLGQKGDDWRAALPRYERIARQHPDIPRAWFNLGYVLVASNDNRRGIEALSRALAMGYRPGTTMYNLGCGHARLWESETAIQWLHRSAAAGFDVAGRAWNDQDLDNVRNDPWLASLVATKSIERKDKRKQKD